MIDQSLFDYFTTHHLPREEVLNRLPFSVSLDEFWPLLLQQRKACGVALPLTGLQGQALWFVLTESIIASGDRIASMARRDIDRVDPCEDMMTEGLMDEAFFTSFVEGAPISRLACRRFLKSGEDPTGVGELLAQNSLSAIRHMAEHRYEPYSSRMILTLVRLLTNAMEEEVEDYRISNTHIIPGRTHSLQQVPLAVEIPGMIDSLCLFLNEYEMHPLLKAAIAQAYILLVRPFDEGNERLARLLSYSILLRKGYSFFRQFALSGMIAQDGMLYYQAMQGIQDSREGGDLTCFMEYYLGMLSRSVNGFDAYLAQQRRDEEKRKDSSTACESPSAVRVIQENQEERLEPPRMEGEKQNFRPKGIDEERKRLLAQCSTPELLVSQLIKQQSISLKIFDTKLYFEKLGLTERKVLRILEDLKTPAAKHIFTIYRYLQSNASKKYSCSELAGSIRIKEGTTRRICYILATLNLIRVAYTNTQGKNYRILCFYVDKAMAA